MQYTCSQNGTQFSFSIKPAIDLCSYWEDPAPVSLTITGILYISKEIGNCIFINSSKYIRLAPCRK